MTVDLIDKLKKLANKQFEIGGFAGNFETIPEDGMVEMGKKKVPWYDAYKLTEEQEQLWRAIILRETGCTYSDNSEVAYMELRYGFVRKLK